MKCLVASSVPSVAATSSLALRQRLEVVAVTLATAVNELAASSANRRPRLDGRLAGTRLDGKATDTRSVTPRAGDVTEAHGQLTWNRERGMVRREDLHPPVEDLRSPVSAGAKQSGEQTAPMTISTLVL